MRDLNQLYRREPALHLRDSEPEGFRWIVGDDRSNSVFAYFRLGEEGHAPLLVVCNMTPTPRPNYQIGVPKGGTWREIMNTDSRFYGGSDMGNGGELHAVPQPMHGEAHSLDLTLPPLATLFLRAES